MRDFSDSFPSFKDKTRVLICSNQVEVAKCIFHTLEFYNKDFDYLLQDHSQKNSDEDFIFLESSTLEIAAQFKPNIVLVTSEVPEDKISEIAKNITGGGVLIYPEKFENILEPLQNYFRKLPFLPAQVILKNGHLFLDTEMGEIPLQSKNENLMTEIKGIQLLSQQFGIMEEQFYDPILSFA
jgi:hypothetical protein